MADSSVIAEFLVSLGYAVDTSSERRATASAARVQRAVTTADKETTQTLSTEAGRRLLAAAREQGAKVQIAGKAAQVAQRARKQADGDERAAVERDRAAQGRSEANRKRLEDAQRAVAGFAIGLTAAAVAAQAAYLRIVGGLDQMQFVSARTGASVSNIEGLSYAFRQLGGTSAQAVGAIEGFARSMRTNPGIQGFVKSLGVGLTDANGKVRDTADVLTDSIDAIRAKHPYYTGAQMAELLGVPEDTFHILDKYADDRKKYERERREVLKAIGLDEKEASESATKFMQALRSLGMVGEVVGKKIASDVAPAFTQFIEGIRDWIAAHPEEIKQAFENIKDAVVGVSQGLNDVFKTLEPVAKGFTHIAESLTGEQGATAAFRTLGWVLGTLVIARLLGVLGLLGRLNVLKLPAWLLRLLGISGTAAAIAGAAAAAGAAQASTAMGKGGLGAGVDPLTGQGSGESNPMGDLVERGPDGKSNVRRWVEKKWENRPAWLGGKASGGSNGTRRGEYGGLGDKAKTIYDTLRGDGWSHEQASAILGNMQEESTFDAKAWNKDEQAGGLIQWRADRLEGLKKFAAQQNADWQDPKIQSRFIRHEMENGDVLARRSGQLFKDAKTFEEANAALKKYIRYGSPTEGDRLRHARSWGAMMSGQAPMPGEAGTQTGGDVAGSGGVGAVQQRQGGGIRNQPITDVLRNQIAAAAREAGVNAEIYSGGQDAHGPHRTGSHRHDHGNSADLKLYTLGPDGKRRYLSMDSPQDRALMGQFVRESVRAGANGIGAGPGYMGEHGIHVGGGSPGTWGAGGSSANAPDWLRRAHAQGMEDRTARPPKPVEPASPPRRFWSTPPKPPAEASRPEGKEAEVAKPEAQKPEAAPPRPQPTSVPALTAASPVPTPAPRPPAPVPAPAPPRRFWIDPPKASGNGGGRGKGKTEDTIRLPEIVVPKAPSPLGASSMNLDNRKNTSIRGGDTTITITGVKDPEKAAAHVGRAVDQSSERNLRNAQTAIR